VDRPPAAVNVALWTQRHGLASLRVPLLERLRKALDDISMRLRAA
jgi:hypothetical protein